MSHVSLNRSFLIDPLVFSNVYLPRHFVLCKTMYPAREVSGHVYMCLGVSILSLLLQCSNCISEQFRQYAIFCFFFSFILTLGKGREGGGGGSDCIFGYYGANSSSSLQQMHCIHFIAPSSLSPSFGSYQFYSLHKLHNHFLEIT